MYPSHIPFTFPSQLHPSRSSRSGQRQPSSFRAVDTAPVLIRPAARGDARAIDRLAALDEHELPRGQRLVGELEGRIVAALEVRSGKTIADPFVPTQGIVELLGLRAAQVRR
jgi:hypothetical protein